MIAMNAYVPLTRGRLNVAFDATTTTTTTTTRIDEFARFRRVGSSHLHIAFLFLLIRRLDGGTFGGVSLRCYRVAIALAIIAPYRCANRAFPLGRK